MLHAFVFAALLAAKSSGTQMCVLAPADVRAAGLPATAKPRMNPDQHGQSAYCTYNGVSGAYGGVELDVFYPAGDTPPDVMQAFTTVMREDPQPGGYLPVPLPGADEARLGLRIPSAGHKPFAAIDVRRGDLVFTISIPTGPHAKAQLLHLSALVLSRLKA
ncbi:MAG TPA: hypothetical protein VGZ02_11565 [Candidatus Baltobacteraceae bacterium]|nr:hypothetical protein [Candidatus Baltobacteraceae bacterium]